MSAACPVAPQALMPPGGADTPRGGPSDRHAARPLRPEETSRREAEPVLDVPSMALVDISPSLVPPGGVPAGPAAPFAGPVPQEPTPLSDAADADAFVSEVARAWQVEAGAPLEPLARGVTAWVDEARAATSTRFDFDIELPHLGVLQGRVSIAHGQAELELRACRPSAAAALRSRQSELQRLLDRESGGDVSLFIV